jgi:hypothetical protein
MSNEPKDHIMSDWTGHPELDCLGSFRREREISKSPLIVRRIAGRPEVADFAPDASYPSAKLGEVAKNRFWKRVTSVLKTVFRPAARKA